MLQSNHHSSIRKGPIQEFLSLKGALCNLPSSTGVRIGPRWCARHATSKLVRLCKPKSVNAALLQANHHSSIKNGPILKIGFTHVSALQYKPSYRGQKWFLVVC